MKLKVSCPVWLFCLKRALTPLFGDSDFLKEPLRVEQRDGKKGEWKRKLNLPSSFGHLWQEEAFFVSRRRVFCGWSDLGLDVIQIKHQNGVQNSLEKEKKHLSITSSTAYHWDVDQTLYSNNPRSVPLGASRFIHTCAPSLIQVITMILAALANMSSFENLRSQLQAAPFARSVHWKNPLLPKKL